MSAFFRNRDVVFYIILLLSIVLTRIPFVGKYFRIVNTLIHESGHALVALLTSAEVQQINLFTDTSGSAITKSGNWFSKFFTSLAGYPSSALAAMLFFYLIKQQSYVYIIYGLGVLAAINLLFFVRNGYGIFWLVTFILILAALIYFKDDFALFCFSVFFSFIVLTDAIISAFHLLIISFHSPEKAGDAKNLSTFAFLPAMVWALVFLAFNCWIIYYTVLNYFPFHIKI